jgi:hypothetical protein
MACDKCAALTTPKPIRSPSELGAAIQTAKRAVSEGILEEVPAGPMAGAIAFSDLQPGGPWDDLVLYKFRCMKCWQQFVLSAEIYHGGGGGWEAEENKD